jgi:phosphatidylethanolamine/phosphatidyl-N-methylethanolamine N-methyltransferase
MRIESNAWNRLRYSVWAPVYDLAGRRFDRFRRESLARLQLRDGERLLLVGAGTGDDLPYVPTGVRTVATDLTPAMLERARPKSTAAHLAVMDGHRLAVKADAFDAAALHLILAVIPDPAACLRETARAVRPGGRIVVFDKFVRGPRVPFVLRVLNVFTRVLATEITRRFEDILERSEAPLVVEEDAPASLHGLFRYVVLRRTR